MEERYTKSALITPFSAEVFFFFCHLPSALCLVPTKKGVVNPDLVLVDDCLDQLKLH
jgi:hypothetical protein